MSQPSSGDWPENKKYILEKIQEHSEDIKEVKASVEAIKITMQPLPEIKTTVGDIRDRLTRIESKIDNGHGKKHFLPGDLSSWIKLIALLSLVGGLLTGAGKWYADMDQVQDQLLKTNQSVSLVHE